MVTGTKPDSIQAEAQIQPKDSLTANQIRELRNIGGIMDDTLHHTRLGKVAWGVWGWVTAVDGWMGGTPHSRRYREREELRETQIANKTRTLIV